MLLVRTSGDPESHVAVVRSAVQGLRVDLPYVSVSPLAERLRGHLQPFRLGALLFTLFGGLAVLLSAVGLYAVLGYFLAERTPEVGIRRALGAPANAVTWLVLRQTLVPVLAGLLFGLGGALGAGRILKSQLFGISPHDPLSLAAAAVGLLAVAALATLLPVLRALRIDPTVALRLE
jgi:ABC-type antimicrobial peptide transport system permease subunit